MEIFLFFYFFFLEGNKNCRVGTEKQNKTKTKNKKKTGSVGLVETQVFFVGLIVIRKHELVQPFYSDRNSSTFKNYKQTLLIDDS